MLVVILRRCALLAIAGAACLPCVGRAQDGAAEVLMPANFQAVNDAQGNFWNLQQQGILNTGSNAFHSAGILTVGGQAFNVQQMQMTQDRSEYVLSGTCGALKVVRRIKFDPAKSSARFIELITNNGTVDLPAVEVRIIASMSQLGTVHTDTGAANPTTLDAKSSGVIASSRFGQVPLVGLWLASPKSKVKPDILVRNRSQLQVSYKVAVPRGKTVAVMHGITQGSQPNGPVANPNFTPDAATLALMMSPFDGKTWGKDLSPEIRRLVTNYAKSANTEAIGQNSPMQSVKELLEEANLSSRLLDVLERGEGDVLILDETSTVQGEASCGTLSIQSHYGNAKFELKDVALIIGGLGGSRRTRVYLRSGEILVGEVTADKFVMKSPDGLQVELNPAVMNLLALRMSPGESSSPIDASALLTTSTGDRLAVKVAASDKLTAATPWGALSLPLAQVQEVIYQPLPQPGFRLRLRDHSRMTVLLTGSPWKLASLRWGPLSIAPSMLRRFNLLAASAPVAAGLSATEGNESEQLSRPCLRLIGDGLLLGDIVERELHLSASGGVKTVDPRTIVSLQRTESDDGKFQCRLASGEDFACQPQEPMVTWKFGEQQWRIPLKQVVGLRGAPLTATPVEEGSPTAPKPPAEADNPFFEAPEKTAPPKPPAPPRNIRRNVPNPPVPTRPGIPSA